MINQNYFNELREIKSKTTWLQYVGAHYGKPASELQVGDVMVWNFGGTSKVTRILKQTEKTIWVEEICSESGRTYERRFKKTRVVAIEGMGVARVTLEELQMVKV